MTIEKYYLTFGFKIKISSLIRYAGYTVEGITQGMRNEWGSHYYEPEYLPGSDGDVLLQWFKDDYLDGGFAGSHEFEINGVQFIIRSFTHDKKEHDEYVVVGVNLGTIENFDGILSATGEGGKEGLRVLVKNDDWARMIMECEDMNGHCGDPVDYGLPNLKYEPLFIIPSVCITTNDCPCCS